LASYHTGVGDVGVARNLFADTDSDVESGRSRRGATANDGSVNLGFVEEVDDDREQSKMHSPVELLANKKVFGKCNVTTDID